MKYFIAIAVTLILAVSRVSAFTSSSSFSGSSLSVNAKNGNGITMEYIPSGISKAQWKKMKEAEKKKKGNLGASGITTFKSRSFADWQKAGGKNLFPVDPKSVKDPKDLPYMQRPGGSADDGDLKKKKKPLFSFGKKKKKEPEPEPEPVVKKLWPF